jgi:hypothetical protein
MGEHRVRIEIGFLQTLITVMLTMGAIALTASVIFTSTVLAFIGLGLIFWGVLFLYIRPEEYTKKALLEAALSPSLATLNQTMQELGYKGDTTYLPPKYFANPETTKVYISKYKRRKLPTPEQTRLFENQAVARTMLGILVTPPGIELSKLLEKSLGTSFIKTNLEKLQQDLPKLFIENLEIAENLELKVENDTPKGKEGTPPSPTVTKSSSARMKRTTVSARITKPIFGTIFKETKEPSQLTSSIGSPICSAIAIAITKATGKPVRITDTKKSEDGNTLEASYKILEE